jgi:KDO2-lipid IV(A) lauroyltransferase
MRAPAQPLIRDLSQTLAGLAYRGGSALACGLPEPLARGTGRLLGLVCWAVQPGRRSTVTRNLARLDPHGETPPAVRARRAYGNFGASVADTLRLARLEPGEVGRRVRFEGLEPLERAAGRGGALLIGAHAGNWEWAGAALAARGWRVAALARPHGHPAQRFFDRLRGRFGVTTRTGLAGLAAGSPPLVAVFCDRPDPGSAPRDRRRTARAALALAARRGWSAFPAVALRTGPGYVVAVGPEILPQRARARRRAAAERAVGFLDARLAARPEEWFAFAPLAREGETR